MKPAAVEELGNDLTKWRAEVRRKIRRGETLEERELIEAFNRWMFGPCLDPDTGEWLPATHRAGSCGVELDERQSAEWGKVGEQVTSSFGGVETCASPWACAQCAAKIRGERAVEVGEILHRHLAAGGHALFLTLTSQHWRGEAAADSFGDAMEAWTKLTRSKPFKRLMEWLGKGGFIRTTEITHSHRSSWHPHHHVALLVERKLTEGVVAKVRGVIDRKWREICVKQGRQVHETAGVTVVPVRDAEGLGWYVSKIELELARGDLKRGYGDNRSPWQIAIEAAVYGDKRDVALWREYVMATRRRHSVSYSVGLLARFGLKEETDEQKAAKLNERVVVAFIPRPMMRAVRKARGKADLRRVLEGGGDAYDLAAAVERCLGRRVGVVVDPIDVAENAERVPVPSLGRRMGVEVDDPGRVRDEGPPVPSLVFLDPDPGPVMATLNARDVRATIRSWSRDARAAIVAGCRSLAGPVSVPV